jgi:hypothetical protein
MFRASRGHMIGDVDTIDGAREILRVKPPRLPTRSNPVSASRRVLSIDGKLVLCEARAGATYQRLPELDHHPINLGSCVRAGSPVW